MGLTPIKDLKKKKKKKKEASNECEKDVESRTFLFQIDSQESQCLRKLLESDLSHTQRMKRRRVETRFDSHLWSFPLFFAAPKILSLKIHTHVGPKFLESGVLK